MGRFGGVLERLEGILERLGRVVERLGGVFERLGALLKDIWQDTENVEKPLGVLAFWSLGRSWRRLGSVLECLGVS